MGNNSVWENPLPIDRLNPEILSPAYASRYLNGPELAELSNIPEAARLQQLLELLERPIHQYSVVNELFFRSKWGSLFQAMLGSRPFTLLEVATGDADMIPQALARTNPGSLYITANMNKRLNTSLLKKVKDLELEIKLIDDDAANLNTHLPEKSLDLIAFQHGVNDVLQTILCARAGIDTVHTDWMETLPRMIGLLQQETSQGTFAESVRAPFLSLLRNLLGLLKDDGILAINHYQFQLDLDWGYPPELWAQLIPLVRCWISELAGCTEVCLDSYSPQWWLFLKKRDDTATVDRRHDHELRFRCAG
jgi:hypothetical protein